MPALQITSVIHGEDLRWMGTSHYRPARTGVLNLAQFAAHVIHGVTGGRVDAGYLPAGLPVTKAADGHYVPYVAGEPFDGVLVRNVSLQDAGNDPLLGAPILDDGRVVTQYVPTADGEPFVAPDKADNNTSIIFV